MGNVHLLSIARINGHRHQSRSPVLREDLFRGADFSPRGASAPQTRRLRRPIQPSGQFRSDRRDPLCDLGFSSSAS